MKKLSIFAILCSAVLFTSCLSIDDTDTSNPVIKTSTVGLFVLNEGNYASNINGSLSYIDYSTSDVTNNLFYEYNGRHLGGTANDMCFANNEAFIACTDDNRVEVIKGTMYSAGYVTITQPREICTDGSYIYVSSYTGRVTKVRISDNHIMAESDSIGSRLEGIQYRNGYLYVCNAYNADYTYNTNVVKLNADDLSKVSDITVACNPTTIKLYDNDLYVLSTGDYVGIQSQVQKIDSLDNVTYLCDATLFDNYGDELYCVNSVTDWTTYQTTTEYFKFANGTKTMFTPATTIPSPCSLEVDPNSGLVFIGSYNIGSTGYVDYAGAGTVYCLNLSTSSSMKFDVGVGPTTMMFSEESYITYE